MRSLLSFHSLLCLPLVVQALHLQLAGRQLTADADGEGEHSDAIDSTTRDILYIANVTIDGVEYPLQMDTGSSDIWVNMEDNEPSNLSTLTYNLTYGVGYAYGPIARGPVSFAGYDIPSQAYIQFAAGTNPVLNFGAQGVVGLGFTGLSHIDSTVTASGADWGRSLLYNIFLIYPEDPNFIAMSLERDLDSANTVIGSLGVGEVVEEYQDIMSTNKIPLYPPSGSTRWTVLVDSIAVDGADITFDSVISSVPDGRVVALLDSGTTYSYAPPEVAQAIYGGVEGAVLNEITNQWEVPCSAGIRLTIWIDGRPFDMHPLDTVVPSLSDSSRCIGSFIPQTLSVGSASFDWILGTNVLRSIYALYDFGDFDSNNAMGDPYIQLLSLVDIQRAAADFQENRGGVVNVDSGNGSPSPGVNVMTTDQKIDKLLDVIPLLFAVLGANALILFVLIAAGIWACCYLRKQKRKPKRAPAPLQLGNVSSREHQYEAVNTADQDEGRPSSVHTRLSSSRGLSRSASKQSLGSIRDGLHELGHRSSASRNSLLRPSINIEDEESRSPRFPVGAGNDSKGSSRLVPPKDGSPSQQHSRVPSNLIPASPSPTAPFFQPPTPTKPSADGGLVDVSLVPHPEAGDLSTPTKDAAGAHLNLQDDVSDLKKKRNTFDPPRPLLLGSGVRQSMASDMSASPTVAGSEAHFGLPGVTGRERTMSAYIPLERPNTNFGGARPNSSYVPERGRMNSGNSEFGGSPLRQGSEPSSLRQSSLGTGEPSPLRQGSLGTPEPSPLRQSSLNSANEPSPLRQDSLNDTDTPGTARTGLTPSPTESQYVDARQSYYSHPNGSLTVFPQPSPETPNTGRNSTIVNHQTSASAVSVVVEEPSENPSYTDDATPMQSPRQGHGRTPSHTQTHTRTSSTSHARTSSKSHTRTASQHSRTGSHARSPSQSQPLPNQPSPAQLQRQKQEAQRAAFMTALDEPLPPPRRPRIAGSGGLAPGSGTQMRMSAYHLNPSQDAHNSAQLNRYSYAPGQDNAAFGRVGMQDHGASRPFPQQEGGPQQSSYVSGQPRRGPFLSSPSPFNPNAPGPSGAPSRAPPSPPS